MLVLPASPVSRLLLAVQARALRAMPRRSSVRIRQVSRNPIGSRCSMSQKGQLMHCENDKDRDGSHLSASGLYEVEYFGKAFWWCKVCAAKASYNFGVVHLLKQVKE